eukprot:5033378-Amphidinium_carterae.2
MTRSAIVHVGALTASADEIDVLNEAMLLGQAEARVQMRTLLEVSVPERVKLQHRLRKGDSPRFQLGRNSAVMSLYGHGAHRG